MWIRLSSTVLCGNVRWLRKKYGMKQVTLAQLVGLEAYDLRRLESGKTLPLIQDDVLSRLSAVFGVAMEELIQRPLYEPEVLSEAQS